MIQFQSIEELLEATKGIEGKTFGEIDKLGYFKKPSMINDKGILGKIIETGFYGYPNNSIAEADFNEIGVELKASGFIRRKDSKWSAKERISLSQINYKKLVEEEYDFSSVVRKNKKILFIWYEYIKGIPKKEFIIHTYQLFDFTEVEDVIKNDYYIIQEKVKKGFAHLLSEGDSVILGAATKSNLASTTTSQPFSEIPTKPRAFSLKNSFIKGILRNHQENLPLAHSEELSPFEWVWKQLEPYIGKTQLEILTIIDGKEPKISKTLGGMITKRIFGNPEKLGETYKTFNLSSYEIKSIPVDPNLFPLEKSTFKPLIQGDFNEEWEDSEWKTYFEELTFIYITYMGKSNQEKIPHGYRKLSQIYKVSFTEEEVESFGKTYKLVQNALQQENPNILPTATSLKNAPLVLSTKSDKGGAYQRFMAGDRSVCFMFNKQFVHQKLLQAEMIQN